MARQPKWGMFPPSLKRLIDEEAAAGNVEALDGYREVWQVSAFGRDVKRPLIAYIDQAQQIAMRERARLDAAVQ